jgi:hypothetical protein
MTTFSNFKTYLPSALKHLFGCHFKHLWKKRNIIATFQLGQLTEQPKTLDDLGRFDLKMFRNCPCFYHGLALYAEYFTTSGSEG